MTDQKYNGWTNYQTWVCKLWMDNDQGTSEFAADQAREFLEANQELDDDGNVSGHDKDTATQQLAQWLEEWHDEQRPEVTGVMADLLGHALGLIDWQEIATSLIDDALEAA
jgi:hypothetical protein